jgi:hypothetical protein
MKVKTKIKPQPKSLAEAWKAYLAQSHNPGREWSPTARQSPVSYEHRIHVVPDKDQVAAFQNDSHGTRTVIKEL